MSAAFADTIRQSLEECFDHIRVSGWKGRERELVSLYAFSFLQKHCALDTIFHDPGQIAIECAVMQVTDGGKERVCKDLLIWPKPHMTVWSSPDDAPLLIMEWKARGTNTVTEAGMKNALRADVEWLKTYTAKHPATLGITVGIDVTPERQSIIANMVDGNTVTENWLRRP